MGAVYLPLESQRRLIGLSRMALEEVVYGAKSQLGRVEDPYLLRSAVASFRSRVRFELEVITPKPVQVHRLFSFLLPGHRFHSRPVTLGVVNDE
jgi:hypothetical protein